jgi:hypothetical protein
MKKQTCQIGGFALLAFAMVLSSCGSSASGATSSIHAGFSSAAPTPVSLSSRPASNVPSARERMTAFMQKYGVYENNEYKLVEEADSSGSYLTHYLFYSPKSNDHVGLYDAGHFVSSTGQTVYFESDQTFTLGSYLATTKVFGSLTIDTKMISFQYSNLTFASDGSLQNYTYAVSMDQYGATASQKAAFAQSVAAYALDDYQWALRKYQAFGGGFV